MLVSENTSQSFCIFGHPLFPLPFTYILRYSFYFQHSFSWPLFRNSRTHLVLYAVDFYVACYSFYLLHCTSVCHISVTFYLHGILYFCVVNNLTHYSLSTLPWHISNGQDSQHPSAHLSSPHPPFSLLQHPPISFSLPQNPPITFQYDMTWLWSVH